MPNATRSPLMPDMLTSRYYEGGISSVYLWDLDDGGFAGVVLFKKGRFPSASADSTPPTSYLISNP